MEPAGETLPELEDNYLQDVLDVIYREKEILEEEEEERESLGQRPTRQIAAMDTHPDRLNINPTDL